MIPVRSASKKSRRSTSLRTTLASAFAVLGILSVLLVGSFQTGRNFQAQRTIVTNQQHIIALNAANEVSTFIEQVFNAMESVAQVSRTFSGTAKENQLMVENLMVLQPALREVALLDEQGQELTKQSRFTIVTNLVSRANDALFGQVSQNQRYISPVYIGEITTEPLVTLAVPLKNPFGDFAGALVAEVNLKFMWDLVASLEVGQEGRAYVVDKQGDLIAFEDISRILRGENLSDRREVAEFMSGQQLIDQTSGNVSVGINNTAVLAIYVPLGKPDWAVVVELPITEAYQPLFLELGISVGAMLVVAILAAIAGVFLSRRLAAPLLNLTEVATQIADGHLELEAPIEGTVEMGQLATTFNLMTDNLRRLIKAEQQAKETLQNTVVEYVGFADRVNIGHLSDHLPLKGDEDDPLIRLGRNINRIVDNLRQRVLVEQEARKSLEQAKEELEVSRDQALAASHLKTEILAKVSHELRSPLGAILGYSQILENGLFGPLSDQQAETISEIIDSTHYLTNMVNELLDQAQLEAGKLKLWIKPFAPQEVLDQVQAKMNVLAQAKGLSLVTSIDPTLPDRLSGDPIRLQQILVNLVSNAIKFTQAGAVQIDLFRVDSTHWALQVSDTGIGIPPEAQSHIFDPFGQVDGSMTRLQIGTGLGLSIVQQLTSLMGGQITLESEVGQGSTFTILLPLELIAEKT